MAKKVNILCCLNDHTLQGVAYVEEEGVEIRFLHPLTNQECERVDQVLVGWSEQDEVSQETWRRLVSILQEKETLSTIAEWTEVADEGEKVVVSFDEGLLISYE